MVQPTIGPSPFSLCNEGERITKLEGQLHALKDDHLTLKGDQLMVQSDLLTTQSGANNLRLQVVNLSERVLTLESNRIVSGQPTPYGSNSYNGLASRLIYTANVQQETTRLRMLEYAPAGMPGRQESILGSNLQKLDPRKKNDEPQRYLVGAKSTQASTLIHVTVHDC